MEFDCVLCQIIKEQLAFPSGTATAQLISVLHRLPPPDTSLRRRAGYSEVSTEESEESQVSITPDTDGGVTEFRAEGEVIRHHGWLDLIWSFSASSLMTVSKQESPLSYRW